MRTTSTRYRTRRARRAFTILELLIVIGILLALGGIVLYNLSGQSDKAYEGTQTVQMQAIKKAIMMFKNDVKRLPTQEEGVVVLWDKSALDDDAAGRWSGPYLESAVPKDMWGHEWVYVFPAEGVAVGFDIVSVGPDGQEGTEDDISLAKGKGNADADFGDFGSGSSSSGSSSGGGTAKPR
jgi:general secretion pathway protein G